jgi:hypothetical protein
VRLQTKEQRAAMRQVFIPKDSAKDPRSSDLGEVYTYQRDGSVSAVAFRGTAGKPEWHYRFRDEQRREARIAEFFQSLQQRAQHMAERRSQRNAFRHACQAGDIFRSSWGYDQTNIDYYQVVELIGEHFAMVREIEQQSQETGFMQGECVPAPGQWATEADYSEAGERHKAEHGHYPRKPKAAFKVKLQGHKQGEEYFKVASYANAYRVKPIAEVAGAKLYASSHWTAYA